MTAKKMQFPFDTVVFHTVQDGKGHDVFLNTSHPMTAREHLEKQGIRVLRHHALVSDNKLNVCHKCIDDDEMWQYVRAFMEHLKEACPCGHHPSDPVEFFKTWDLIKTERAPIDDRAAQPPPSRFGPN